MKIKIFATAIFVLLAFFASAQNGYSLQKVKLPFAAERTDVYVKTSGNYYIMNDDIIVGKRMQHIAYTRPAEEGWSYIWPKGYIPVAMEDSISLMGFEGEILRALDYLNANTRLRFKPRTTEADYIFINYQTVAEMGFMGGNSWAGRQGGSQVFNISTTNFRTIVHELLHAVGFWHEQSRHDRDLYIDILWNNIRDSAKHNYQIEPGLAQGDYDYMSIMHYWNGAFSKNGNNTMRCKFGNFISDCAMGGELPSTKDLQAINSTYWFNDGVATIDFGNEFRTLRELALSRQLTETGSMIVSEAVNNAKRQDITEGIYKIKVNQTGKHLAIEGVSKENGARLVQWDYVDQNNHKFYVTKRADNSFTLWGWDSRKYVCAASGNKEDGTAVIQDSFADHLGIWKIEYSNQQGCKPGWIVTNVVTGKPLHLVGDGNGAGFELRAQQFQDGDYACAYTFEFEKLKDDSMEKKTTVPLNNTQKMKKTGN